MTTLARRWFIALAAVSLAACLDLTPSAIAKVADDAAPGTSMECLQCLSAPSGPGQGCGAELVACQKDPICSRGMECTFRQGCYRNAEELPICFRACADLVGFRATDSPETKLGLDVYQCATTHCRDVCLTSADAGPRPDGGPADGSLDDGAVDAQTADAGADASGGACTNPADQMAEATATFASAPRDCGFMCFGVADPNCASQCMQGRGLSGACAACWGDSINCGIKNCLGQCLDSEKIGRAHV